MKKKGIVKVYISGTPEKDFASEKWEPSCYLCHKTQKDESITMDCFSKMERLPVLVFTMSYIVGDQELVYFLCGYCRLLVEAILEHGERLEKRMERDVQCEIKIEKKV